MDSLDVMSPDLSLAEWIDSEGIFVAELDGEIVGFVAVDESFFERPFIVSLFVADPYRRRGAGAALLTTVVTARAPARIFTSTNCSNAAMQQLLTSEGWRACGMVDGLDDGDPELFYYLDVGDPED